MRFIRFRDELRLMTNPPDDPDMWNGDPGLARRQKLFSMTTFPLHRQQLPSEGHDFAHPSPAGAKTGVAQSVGFGGTANELQ